MANLSRLNVWRWLANVAADWLWITSGMAVFWLAVYAATNMVWMVVAGILGITIIGIGQHRLALMGHEGAPHRCVSRSRRLNDLLAGVFAFWPIGFSLAGYSRFHLLHHETVGTDSDPEWAGHKSRPWLGQWRPPWRTGVVALQLLGDLCGFGVPHIVTASTLTAPQSIKEAAGPFFVLGGMTALCLATGQWWIPLAWFLSLLTTFWAVFRSRLWLEHAGLETVGPGKQSTYRVHVPFWLRFAISPHNGDCHWEHHWSWDRREIERRWQIPCWNLRMVRKLSLERGIGPEVITFSELIWRLKQRQS